MVYERIWKEGFRVFLRLWSKIIIFKRKKDVDSYNLNHEIWKDFE